ncbi:ABC transporter permease [Chitinophaga parva]|uniref:ABC transporter permease n=1 Tax=Chitinophaga parva TaxID=2169414 RepID=A0A2T7BPR8_9BACT|nr:ABC transporter permease [Chitinophaga parva]PUZ29674.1 ABC transporter permease [Chitinophaga parva]
MFKNYLKMALRNLRRHSLFAGLNIFGLAIGMACSILIFLWVQDENSYDRFHPNAGQTYRLVGDVMGTKAAVTPWVMGPELQRQLPGVEHVTRVNLQQGKRLVSAGGRKFEEKNVLYADSNFLQMFNYPLLEGDAATVLGKPHVVLVSRAAAQRYFGKEDPVGKTLHIDNSITGVDVQVAGVLKDIPHNSHLQFDFLLPFSETGMSARWNTFAAFTYLQLQPGVDLKQLVSKINDLYKEHDNGRTPATFSLQPLTSVHLQSDRMMDVPGQGNAQYVRIMLLVGIFVLVIACINFMNLSTAVAGKRAKEVGLRKTVGALRRQLFLQFIAESFVTCLLALILGSGLAYALLPYFNQLADKQLHLQFTDTRLLGILLCIALGVGLLSGAYPALFLSRFNPVQVLKGQKTGAGRRSLLRNGLVILQFSISVILMVCTVVVYKQLQFIRQRDMGFNKDNLLYVEMPRVGDLFNQSQALKTALQQQTGLADYSIVSELPVWLTNEVNQLQWPGKTPDQEMLAGMLSVDGNFTRTFGVRLLAGRFLEDGRPADDSNFVVNEAALRAMHMQPATALGQSIGMGDEHGTIVGVVQDFNFKPVQEPVEPLFLRHNRFGGFFVIRTSGAALQSTIERVQTLFKQVYHDYPFNYGFVADDINRLYASERRMGSLVNIFAALSIIISCLGLFGLVTFATQQRVKEIGIRKVMGAGEAGIVALLTKDFIALVALALLVAFPVAHWLMGHWLAGFAYHVHLSWWIFVVAGITAICIALATISFQAIRAATVSPVKSLKAD